MSTDAGQVKIRLGDRIQRVERFHNHLNKITGIEHSRSDAVLALLERGLKSFESEQNKESK